MAQNYSSLNYIRENNFVWTIMIILLAVHRETATGGHEGGDLETEYAALQPNSSGAAEVGNPGTSSNVPRNSPTRKLLIFIKSSYLDDFP
ncbi:hypothetical protein T265_02746 [Opisthorchis viverrini]|uniref:Uncharacterized protein n=1 Tax=Opisthorchis viverrini TaxID=6198 RepID=A0A075AI33_OPIVI|nr:hypothetical protein T265_02746 [Opisthorchis viverrini]KER30934.1 hypothetical protein T265_02746 [Opisthorchis viverrini]